ncbi:uncharacterized protein LOC131930936 isoform X2 [Physella acuta]|uniref:uncharacterized protein LOC131930936 isoform X2 n=1 Tax=Physella acuta TaxID=109671 RepID=UPI0027DE497B|nr:uncharacterized protein LOC131930936 isoform X2 [Physella acuta]XP_059143584.1 uncharacterized protein LOC131930936 isoform X2 [Physella acuta]
MSENCSRETGLILSSFEVLQDHQSNGRQIKLTNAFSNGLEERNSAKITPFGQGNVSMNDSGHCGPCTNDGDEMFDDNFRGDEAVDSLDNDTNNNSLDREDDGDDEEDDDDDEDEEASHILQQEELQGTNQTVSINVESGSTSSDPRNHHSCQDNYVNTSIGMAGHSFVTASRNTWKPDPTTPNASGRYSGEWHIPLSTPSNGLRRDSRRQDEFSSPDLSRDGGVEEQHWKFVHGHAADQHQHWGQETKVVVGSANTSWVTPKRSEDQVHDLQGLHPHSNLDHTGHWSHNIRTGQPNVHGWSKELGGVYTTESEINNVRNLFTLQPAQPALNATAVNTTFNDMRAGSTWNLGSHHPAGQALGNLQRPLLHHDMACHRTAPTNIFHQSPSQNYAGFQSQEREEWPASALSPGPSGITTDVSADHFKLTGVQRNPVCKSAILNKQRKGRNNQGGSALSVSETQIPTKVRPTLDQVREQSHPYQIKEQKKIVRDVYPATSANVHTLKASHIVSWYIDYLIHENEHLTQISRAFSLPVNLFHSDDFYFMDSLKKKVHFPSLKFLSWMQQNLPSINVNAIDFHEGRPPALSTWNQDWFWQNKSRRDIIHDVFFYFQHRRVTCEN